MIELDVDRVAAGGDGVAREPSGRVVFVPGALPGERVRARLVEERRDFARAEAVAVISPSPFRVAPPCPYVAAGCGGCGWQHVEPAEQARLKRAIVVDALARIGKLHDPVVEIGPALAPTGFRTTLRVAVHHGRPGWRKSRSHEVVTVKECLVAHPLLQELLAAARFPAAGDAVLRCSAATGERIAWPRPSARGSYVPAGVRVGRRAVIHEAVAGRIWRVSAPSFFQTRPDGATALVAAVRDAAGELASSTGPLVDAYSGVGLFAGTLGAGRDVVAIEQSAASVADAAHNLADLDVTFVATDVATWTPAKGSTVELVVADPPREGLRAAAARRLGALGADRLVLVSCDAAALGRDAHLLGAAGYGHVRSEVIDLFPHTPHVEVVTRFDRR